MAQTEWPIQVTDNASALCEKAAALISKYSLEPVAMPSALCRTEAGFENGEVHVTVYPSTELVLWFLDLVELAARSR